MATLPSFLVIGLKIEDETIYASHINEGSHKDNILFSADGELVNPNTKFAVENVGDDGLLVHIKSCYNNKYLCRESNDDYYLSVASNEAVEDETNWKCTLFRQQWSSSSSSEEPHYFSLTHLQSGKSVLAKPTPDSDGNTTTHILWVDHEENNSTTFVAIDYSTIVKLPKFVAFKFLNRNRYLKGYLYASEFQNYVYFTPSADSSRDDAALFEILPGSKWGDLVVVRIKSHFNDNFLRVQSTTYIYADWEDPTSQPRQILFRTLKGPGGDGNNNVISFLTGHSATSTQYNMGSYPGDWVLSAAFQSPTDVNTHVRVEEAVGSRRISVTNFRVEDARIYSVSDTMVVFASIETEENRGDTTIEVFVKLSYQITQTTSWDRLKTVTDKLEETKSMTTFVSSGVPELVSDSEIGVRTRREWEYSGGEFGWGERVERVKEDEYSLLIEVMPMTKKIVTVIGKLGQCDVPFSYIQTDQVFNGETVTFNNDDGLFSGVNAFDVKARIVQQQLT